ncbi:MAG: LamG-like jellyroll fold domain-containing protein [Patescibacteria group bacterium]
MRKKASLIIMFLFMVPLIKEGSFLSGQSLSVWPSWSVLGNAVGVALPVDPINKLAPAGTCASSTNHFCVKNTDCPAMIGTTTPESCILHDPATGWSTVNRRFSFACSTSSYAYRYIDISTTTYKILAHFEDPFGNSNAIANWNDNFVYKFVSTTESPNHSYIVISQQYGICNNDQEISTLQQGSCGDKVLNPNEQCDPPGSMRYSACSPDAIHPNQIRVDKCGTDCKWSVAPTYILCSALSKCGNGIIESGEQCDDGRLNGTYNHCNTSCTGKVAPYSSHNPNGSPGYCGDGVSPNYIVNPKYEVCDKGGVDFWALQRANSCSWNCQGYGPYCGDGVKNGSEECDGNQPCTASGKNGTIVCDNTCHIVYPTQQPAVANDFALWTFDNTDMNGSTIIDKSGNGQDAMAYGTYSIVNGHSGQAIQFDGQTAFVSSTVMNFYKYFSADFWMKINQTDNNWRMIMAENNWNAGLGWMMYTSQGSASGKANFTYMRSGYSGVAVADAFDVGVWQHVKVVNNNGSAKVYVNDILKGSGAVSISNAGNNLLVGAGHNNDGTGASGYFNGIIDEVHIANSSTTPLLQSCTVAVSQEPTSTPGACGDGHVDASEACDKGANNGKPCTPGYDKACSYCSADCQNVIDVQPTAYCGNGLIEGTEVCDTDPGNGDIYVSSTVFCTPTNEGGHGGGLTCNYPDILKYTFQNPVTGHGGLKVVKDCESETANANTVKKGIKACVNNCKAVKLTTGEDQCIACGLDPVNGVEVGGYVLNAIDPLSGNPLMGVGGHTGSQTKLELYLGTKKDFSFSPITATKVTGYCAANTFYKNYSFSSSVHPDACNNTRGLLNPNPICSTGKTSYKLIVNDGTTHVFPFSVISDPLEKQPWRNDLLLSPMIPQPSHIRVVVSWVGDGEFYSGFLDPAQTSDPIIEGSKFVTGDYVDQTVVYNYSTGKDYYTQTDSDHKKLGIWYHGFGDTPNLLKEESFTVDTANMDSGNYVFYVRSGGPIKPYQVSANLKVEVYLPEGDTNYRHFGLPAATYYLSGALPSDSPAASYWQVFNIVDSNGTVTLADNILDVNSIVSAPRYFIYSTSCIGRAGRLCRASAGPCDTAEYCVAGNDVCPEDSFRSATAYCYDNLASKPCYSGATCSGYSADCPQSTYKAAGLTCTGFVVDSECENPATCNGTSYECTGSLTLKPDGTSCGNVCNNNVCQGGSCRAGTPTNCASSNPCKNPVCDPLIGCTYKPIGSPCSTTSGSGTCQFHLGGGDQITCKYTIIY